MKTEKSCGAIVYIKNADYKFLIIRQKKGHWSFPKGKTETSEKELDTAKREIYEETELNVKLVHNFREEINYFKEENVYKTVVFFLAESSSNIINIQKYEISDYAWLSYNDALKKLTYNNTKQVLEKANEFLTKFQ